MTDTRTRPARSGLARSLVPRSVLARAAALPGRAVLGNMGARIVALASVALVTVLVARAGGAGDVGLLALMRVIPGVVGVLAACGLPSAVGYFVAGPGRSRPGLWPTIAAIMTAGAAVGMAAWLALTPVIHARLMATTSTLVVAVVGVTVATQLPVAVGKACLQALDDSRGSSLAIAAEEASFVPAYAIAWGAGLRSGWLLVIALLLSDVAVAGWAWLRIRRILRAGRAGAGAPAVAHEPAVRDPALRDPALQRRGRHRGTPRRSSVRPDRALAGELLRFGMRSQVGGVVSLLNLRLDVVILGAFSGPASVGVYVVASKYAELLRLPSLALTWVAYPRVARDGAAGFTERARRLMWRLVLLGVGAAVVLAAAAIPLLPVVYGPAFQAAVWPAVVIAAGLVAEPAAGLASAILMGTARPGVNSAILGVGLAITVALDILLIPRHGAMGAAGASAVAYLATDLVLIGAMRRGPRPLGVAS